MNRHERRKQFKGFEKMHGRGQYADLSDGFERDLMVAICRAVTPGRGDIIMSDSQIVDAVFSAIQQDALDVWFRWTDSGAEVKTELRVPGCLPIVPVSTFIAFEEAYAA